MLTRAMEKYISARISFAIAEVRIIETLPGKEFRTTAIFNMLNKIVLDLKQLKAQKVPAGLTHTIELIDRELLRCEKIILRWKALKEKEK